MTSSKYRGTKLNSKHTTKTAAGKTIRTVVSRTHKPDNMGLEEWQRMLRRQYGEQQDYRLENVGEHPIFSDFRLFNPQTQKTYKISIRGNKPWDNYCSCPDFQVNNLGTCKHISFTLSQLMKIKDADVAFSGGYTPLFSEIFLKYGLKKDVCFKAGIGAPPELIALAHEFFDENGLLRESHLLDFPRFLDRINENNGHEVRCYDDVMTYIAEHQDKEYRDTVLKERLKQGTESPVLKNILKTNLYQYQKEGILFAVRAGRCLIGDDMGLGKTIQAMAAAELMARLFHMNKVLIVSPTSLKYQWKSEIDIFTGRKAVVIEGLNNQRRMLYEEDTFYKLVNYELIWRDMEFIREWAPDLIILDEAQRIKNWKTRTAKYIKQLESTFAIVLTGTPIENRIEELHSIMEFIDRHHFGPLYRFVSKHRILDDSGKVIGYRDLESVRRSLEGIMIRRKKDEVLKQLPLRIDKHFFVPMTKEQRDIHDENYEIVVRIVGKWRRYKFLSEADHRRMQIAMSMMRMAADNTYLVDKKTVHGPKIDELEALLQEIVIEGREKVVIFSQWLRMTELVEDILKKNNILYVHLNGAVASKDRKELMSRFREDPDCMVFLSTDAGGVGLNLQSGSVVINMDIPWNPAVLEQRIGRVHRLGQRRMVRVINFVTKLSIEERILELLKFKKSLFAGALDEGGQDVVMIGESQMKKFMETVEAVTEDMKSPGPMVEAQERNEFDRDMDAMDRKEAEEEEQSDELGTAGDPKKSSDADTVQLNSLIMKGAEFLINLGQALSHGNASPSEIMESQMQGIIGKDEQTGRSYLKVPIPEPDVVQGLFVAVGEALTGFLKKKA